MSKAKSDKISPDLDTPTDLPQAAVDKISASLNTLLADAFALYVKTKNFHWHVSGRHFRDYHLMLDEQSDAIFATTDQLAERVRKLGGTTLRSIGQIGKAADHQGQQRELRAAARDAARVDGRQQAHGGGDAQRRTSWPTITRIPAPPDCSKPSSTRPSAVPGSCSKPAARKAATRRNTSHNRHCEERMRRRLRHSGAMRSIEPGSSKFRVRAGARPGMTAGVDRNDGSATCPCARASDRQTA